MEDNKSGELSVYPEILIEEQDVERLLAYVSNVPSRIERYYKYLVPQYQKEVISLFLSHIRESAACSSKRSEYREVCNSIRRLQKAGGRKETRDIVQELLNTYRRRPALRDELMAIPNRVNG